MQHIENWIRRTRHRAEPLQASRRLVPPSCILPCTRSRTLRGGSKPTQHSIICIRGLRSAPGPASRQGVLPPRAAMNTLSRNLTPRSGHQTTGGTAQRFAARASSLMALSRPPAYTIRYRENRLVRMRHRAETLSRRLVPPSCILVGEAVRREQTDTGDSVLSTGQGGTVLPPPSCVMYTPGGNSTSQYGRRTPGEPALFVWVRGRVPSVRR
jgi:hypothetical protein